MYAHDRSAPEHAAALAWWERVVNGSEVIGLPWMVTIGFVRLATSRRAYQAPLPVETALSVVEGWFHMPLVEVIHPGKRHLGLLSDLLRQIQVAGPITTNAHIAALAIEHRAVVHTHDRDFERFSGVRIYDPLKA